MIRDVWAEINARPSSLRPFGSALIGGDGGRTERALPITVRPIRLKADNGGRCPTCGDRYFGCPCDLSTEEPATAQQAAGLNK